MATAITDAQQNIEHWFSKKSEAHFESAVLCVHKSHYPAKLQDIKDRLLAMQADLEESPADQLVRFSVQIYPLAKP